MNAERIRLTEEGWSIIEVEADDGVDDMPAPEDAPDLEVDLVADCIVRDGEIVTVKAEEVEPWCSALARLGSESLAARSSPAS